MRYFICHPRHWRFFAANAEPEKEQSQDEMLLQEALEQDQEVYLAECESQDTVTLLFAGRYSDG